MADRADGWLASGFDHKFMPSECVLCMDLRKWLLYICRRYTCQRGDPMKADTVGGE